MVSVKYLIKKIQDDWRDVGEFEKTVFAGELGTVIIFFGLVGISFIQQMLHPTPYGVDIPVTQPGFSTPMGALIFVIFILLIFFLIGAGTYTVYRFARKWIKK